MPAPPASPGPGPSPGAAAREALDRGREVLSRVRIVLVATQHPGNIGSAARAMLTMGLHDLVLVAPQRFPHPQAEAMASGASGVLASARVVATLAEAIADCGLVIGTSARPRHLGDQPLPPWEAADALIAQAVASAAPVALVFGCERTGLTNEELEQCHRLTLVPANPQYSSLNLAAAVQLYGYELRKTAIDERPSAPKSIHPWYQPPTGEQLEHFYEHLERVLLRTGFLDPKNPRLLMRRLRQLFSRARPDLNELNILRGILTTVEKPKLRTPRKKPGQAR